MLLRGICVGFGVAIWETMLMELVPENLLSRVVSLDYFGSFGLMPRRPRVFGGGGAARRRSGRSAAGGSSRQRSSG